MADRKKTAVEKTALKLAQALERSCDAMIAYTAACRDAGLPFKGLDDSRVLLMEDMVEFSCHLRAVYDKEGGL